MERRSFLKGILALGVAPAIITTPGLLMPLRKEALALPLWYKGEGLIKAGSLPTILWPGVKALWDKHYAETEDKPWLSSYDPETGLYLPK